MLVSQRIRDGAAVGPKLLLVAAVSVLHRKQVFWRGRNASRAILGQGQSPIQHVDEYVQLPRRAQRVGRDSFS